MEKEIGRTSSFKFNVARIRDQFFEENNAISDLRINIRKLCNAYQYPAVKNIHILSERHTFRLNYIIQNVFY